MNTSTHESFILWLVLPGSDALHTDKAIQTQPIFQPQQ